MAGGRREATAAASEARAVVEREAARGEAVPSVGARVEAARAAAVGTEVVREAAARSAGPEAATVAAQAAERRAARPAYHNCSSTAAPPAEARVGTTGEAAARGRMCSQDPRRCCRTPRCQPSSLRARIQA